MDSNNEVISKIAVFNATTSTWIELMQGLHSTNTSELVVLPFPISSLDCLPDECHCGIANRRGRIFGGNNAEVRNISSLHRSKIHFQADSYPWLAALVQDGDIQPNFINNKCGAVLVGAPVIAFSGSGHIFLS